MSRIKSSGKFVAKSASAVLNGLAQAATPKPIGTLYHSPLSGFKLECGGGCGYITPIAPSADAAVALLQHHHCF